MIILGVDSGSTKTMCAIVNESFEVLGVGISGPSNYHVVGIEQAKKNVSLSIESACYNAGLQRGNQFDIGCFGMGGLDNERDRQIISGFITSLNISKEYEIVNDVVVAYYAVTLGEPGVGVVAGTGSIAYASDGKGTTARAGGWGWLIGDEGSAFYIAREALAFATKAFDGRGSYTEIINLAKKHFGISNFEEIITAIYQDLPAPRDLSLFAEAVSLAAEEGDAIAREILAKAGRELALSAEAAARKVGITDLQIVVGGAGGVWRSDTVWKTFKSELKKKLPRSVFRGPIEFPVIGAIVMGMRKKGIKISETDAEKLERNISLKLKEVSSSQ